MPLTKSTLHIYESARHHCCKLVVVSFYSVVISVYVWPGHTVAQCIICIIEGEMIFTKYNSHYTSISKKRNLKPGEKYYTIIQDWWTSTSIYHNFVIVICSCLSLHLPIVLA